MGYLRFLERLDSPHEGGKKRTVRILAPSSENGALLEHPPVLYLQDGQNVFSGWERASSDSWCADVVMESLVAQGAVEPWLLVAVDSDESRDSDYSPWERGEQYARFLVETLRPYVEARFGSRKGSEWTAVAGSSLGGLISLYLSLSFPAAFGRVAALSPTVMWAEGQLFREWRAHSRQWSRIYLDAGASEVLYEDGRAFDYAGSVWAFWAHLKELVYADHEVRLVLEPGGSHHERDWQRRLPDALRWLLG
ncbi:alpha/beta hydrolase [Archangium sp.]|uniref:alpha/beta hydrolase n=1 Tax=Archangium sp. TaxID=1872627 RepID=UPI002D285BD3|nr:alpha/beta hydrolase-fold protein [Archangium sp.]HYO56538.1 alpha/beta hydrolase-fold protein [Archangium sp.]